MLHAGAALRRRFLKENQVRAKRSAADYCTEADLEAERIMVGALLRAFPQHEIHSEEAGLVRAGGPFRWLIDPLDGTHNYVSGIPLYGVVLTLFAEDRVEACVLHDAHLGRTVIARRGHGVVLQGGGVRAAPLQAARRTASVLKDYRDSAEPSPAHQPFALPTCLPWVPERVLDLWAPCIDGLLFATRHTGALVADGWSGAERHAVVLAATEAGGQATDWNGHPIDPAAPPSKFLIIQSGPRH